MPYTTPGRRVRLESSAVRPETAGELNYAITKLLIAYAQPLSYQKINDVLGALEGAKAEFYRRVAAPYEDIKIQENGDVY
ncbi:MAG: hypothetical protein KGL39_07125 [Patescibacteria group bacterium]|nr:hypothetical protein [Patescibacteria group bacterium]